MAQVFQPRFSLLLKFGLLGVLGGIVLLVFIYRFFIAPPFALGEPVHQPVPFSHKHHVRDDGIDCRYCHTSVEKSAFAGIPPTEICMTCHSQLFRDSPVLAPVFQSFAQNTPIHWRRVYTLPDFVYFDHSIHINKGIGCVSCHGQIDQMPLTWRAQTLDMQWCLNCHRDPASHLRPHEHVFDLHWVPSKTDLAVIMHGSAINPKETLYPDPYLLEPNIAALNSQARPPAGNLWPANQQVLEKMLKGTLDIGSGRLSPIERRQLGMGLARQNNVLDTKRLTDCSTCHR